MLSPPEGGIDPFKFYKGGRQEVLQSIATYVQNLRTSNGYSLGGLAKKTNLEESELSALENPTKDSSVFFSSISKVVSAMGGKLEEVLGIPNLTGAQSDELLAESSRIIRSFKGKDIVDYTAIRGNLERNLHLPQKAGQASDLLAESSESTAAREKLARTYLTFKLWESLVRPVSPDSLTEALN